ncbi:MAG TPA: SCP2 sterol-binding domain-containing protein [Acidimicrobiales bacterium]|nr:SCP2 sterol-binding domain-containing protein [Acidimicrobiales bacterium]
MRFLSAEWLERMAAATAPASPGADVAVHQRVTGGPDGDVEYTLRVGGGKVAFEPGPATGADVTLVSDYATAAAISQGRLSPAAAFAAGRLRVIGPVGPLVASQEVFAGMGRLLAGVSESTTY